jgi:hypothetical protein
MGEILIFGRHREQRLAAMVERYGRDKDAWAAFDTCQTSLPPEMPLAAFLESVEHLRQVIRDEEVRVRRKRIHLVR